MPDKRIQRTAGAPQGSRTRGRAPLTRERVLGAAVELADAHGVGALTMRRLGKALGVEAMSLYNHVASKDDLLDGVIDLVIGAVGMPDLETDWRSSIRARTVELYRALLRHPWAGALIESRNDAVPSRMQACDATIGVLREAGFSVRDAARAFLTLDSYLYGFVVQQSSWSFTKASLGDFYEEIAPKIPESQFPNIVELIRFLIQDASDSGEDALPEEEMYLTEFLWGLDLLLDGLERMRAAPPERPRAKTGPRKRKG